MVVVKIAQIKKKSFVLYLDLPDSNWAIKKQFEWWKKGFSNQKTLLLSPKS